MCQYEAWKHEDWDLQRSCWFDVRLKWGFFSLLLNRNEVVWCIRQDVVSAMVQKRALAANIRWRRHWSPVIGFLNPDTPLFHPRSCFYDMKYDKNHINIQLFIENREQDCIVGAAQDFFRTHLFMQIYFWNSDLKVRATQNQIYVV